MEIEFTDNNRRRKVFLVLGVVLALVAGGAAFYLSSQGSAQAAPVPLKTVIVAAREIPARTVVDSGMLAQREVPDDPTVANALDDANLVVGRVTSVTVYAEQPITPNLLATSAAGVEFQILAPTETIAPDSPLWRAVSITVPKERAVGGHVEVGQHIDLFVTVDFNVMSRGPDGELTNEPDQQTGYYSEKSTKITWEDVELLAKDADADTYIFKVDLHQAEEINHVLATGADSFSMALRPDGDIRIVDRSGYGETTNRIIEQYNLPVPRLIDTSTYQQPFAEPAPFVPGQAVTPAASPGASPSPTPAP